MLPIITSILDNDLYKFSMAMAVYKKFPNKIVKYKFTDRNFKSSYSESFLKQLKQQITKWMPRIKMTKEEYDWLNKNVKFLDKNYLDFLYNYRFNPDQVKVELNNDLLKLEIEGYWYETIFWEVPLLAIISQLSLEKDKPTSSVIELDFINHDKIDKLTAAEVSFADLGTRRRYSFDNHQRVLSSFKRYSDSFKNSTFIGTSNLYFAKQFNIKPIGTQAHEWIMFHGAMYGYKMANYHAMENWVDVFRGELGIALTDTYTTDVFLRSFDTKFAKLFDGLRQDSGDPYVFGEKIIKYYKKLGIDPMSKTIIFSDGLNTKTAIEINEHFKGRIKCSFGIGTHFTNDVGVKPKNIVIKLSEVFDDNIDDWTSTIKLSDSVGKHHGNFVEVELCKNILKING